MARILLPTCAVEEYSWKTGGIVTLPPNRLPKLHYTHGFNIYESLFIIYLCEPIEIAIRKIKTVRISP